MKRKQIKSSYEAPCMDVQLYQAEGILCMSDAAGSNESYEDSEYDYTFTFTM